MANARGGLIVLEAHITFLARSDERAPHRFCTGYRNSNVWFAGLEPIACVATFRLLQRDCLVPGESDLAEVWANGPADMDKTLSVGGVFHLLESGRRIVDGAITRIVSFQRS